MVMMLPAVACAAFGGVADFWGYFNLFLLKIEMKCELWMILHGNATKDVR